jgi:hypothetical protein
MGKKSKRKTKTKVVVDDVTITSDEELFKDPPGQGGLSHLLPTNAYTIVFERFTSSRDYIVRAN